MILKGFIVVFLVVLFIMISVYVVISLSKYENEESSICALDNKPCNKDCDCVDCGKYRSWQNHFSK